MDWLSKVIDPAFLTGFVGGLLVTAFVVQGVMEVLRLMLRVNIPAKCALIVALPVGCLVAWAWTAALGGKVLEALIIRDGLINAAASTVAYENIVKPLLLKAAKVAPEGDSGENG